MEKREFGFIDLIVRYGLAIIAVIWVGQLFYYLFQPLTISFLELLLKIFYNVNVIENSLFILNKEIVIIPACIGGSAYLLFLILNLLTPKIKFIKRIYLFIIHSFVFFLFNIIRLFISSILFINNSSSFNLIHQFLWFFGSIIFVLMIWFLSIIIFKIREIPLYSDIIRILDSVKKKQ